MFSDRPTMTALPCAALVRDARPVIGVVDRPSMSVSRPQIQLAESPVCREIADHKTLLVMEKEVDGLVAKIEAGAPVDATKTLLADIAVSAFPSS